MPNWCKNRVTVWSSMSDKETDQLNRIKEIFTSKDTVFGKIIPSPDWATIPNEDGELPTVREHKNPKTGEVSFVTTEFPKSGKQDSRLTQYSKGSLPNFRISLPPLMTLRKIITKEKLIYYLTN